MLILISVLIGLFGVWQNKFLSRINLEKKKRVLYIISFLIIFVGILKGILVIGDSYEIRKLKEERLILSSLKIKYEIIGPSNRNAHIGHILGTRLRLRVYNKKDSMISPFYLYSPNIWDITELPSNQIKANIIFNSSPDLFVIGKRVKFLEKYDVIEFPLGIIAKAMNLTNINDITSITQVIYINGLEIRRLEKLLDNLYNNQKFEITDMIVSGWTGRPFRNIEQEYLNAIRKSSGSK